MYSRTSMRGVSRTAAVPLRCRSIPKRSECSRIGTTRAEGPSLSPRFDPYVHRLMVALTDTTPGKNEVDVEVMEGSPCPSSLSTRRAAPVRSGERGQRHCGDGGKDPACAAVRAALALLLIDAPRHYGSAPPLLDD
jgi:hypothetical protein